MALPGGLKLPKSHSAYQHQMRVAGDWVQPHWAGRYDAEAEDSPLVLSTLLPASACEPGSWSSLHRTPPLSSQKCLIKRINRLLSMVRGERGFLRHAK